MDIIQHNISPLIDSQFPSLYREEGPRFVKFFKYYIQWLEQTGNPLYYNRRFVEFKDIDESVDQFLVYFKQKYLNGISLDSAVKTKQLLKHSLDLYRSKGTEQGIDLLLRAEYGHGASIYYPSTDMLSLSAGKWIIPKYLEVSLNENLALFVDKEIMGSKSGATAFIERAVRSTHSGKILDILYMSSVEGDFEVGDIINTPDKLLPMEDCPVVIGSFGEIEIDLGGTGYNFSIGNRVDIYSASGFGAKGVVTSVKNVSGLVDFSLVNGGYGYTSNAVALISEKYLVMSNLQITNTSATTYFELFETLTQPTYYLNYINSSGTFTVGKNVYSYFANNGVEAVGRIIKVTSSNSTAGSLKVQRYNGTFGNLAIYGQGNTITANLSVINSVTNSTATGNVIAYSSNVALLVNGNSNTYTVGERVYQIDEFSAEIANGDVEDYYKFSPSYNYIKLSNVAGVFRQGSDLYTKKTTLNISNVISQNVAIGVIDINNDFTTDAGNYAYSNYCNGTIAFISTGAGASINVSSDNMLYTEDVTLDTDNIADYVNTAGNAVTYGFPASPSGNSATPVNELLNTALITFGKEVVLTGLNPGTDYNAPPFVLLYDRYGYMLKARDKILYLEGVEGAFVAGELITQETSNARGLITSYDTNTDTCVVENLRVLANNSFVVTSNVAGVVTGEISGATANVTYVDTYNATSYTGINATLQGELITGNGAVDAIKVIDSGFNFTEGEYVYFTGEDGTGTIGRGVARLTKHGTSEGFFGNRNGFLSDRNRLRDGHYYQEYSYDIKTAMELAKYEESLKRVMHVAGTKYFGTLVYYNKVNTDRPKISTAEIIT